MIYSPWVYLSCCLEISWGKYWNLCFSSADGSIAELITNMGLEAVIALRLASYQACG